MDKEKKDELSNQAVDFLTELGNIGVGNASTALSVMLESRLTISTPTVDIYNFNDLANIFGGPETPIVGVLSNIVGDLDAMILFVMGLDDAQSLVVELMGEQYKNIWNQDMGLSAIREIANIMIGSYVSSLETLSGKVIRYNLPLMCIDMAASILSVPCVQLSSVSDNALLINSDFKVGDRSINGYIMLISAVHSYDAMLAQLGIGGIDE